MKHTQQYYQPMQQQQQPIHISHILWH